MKNALFIHGLNSDCFSETGNKVKKILESCRYKTINPSFDVLSPKKTLEQINRLIVDENIQLIIGHSLGGFFTAACMDEVKKIFINPCLDPDKVLHLINDKINKKILNEFIEIKKMTVEKYLEHNLNKSVYGLFGNADELFSHLDTFKSYYKDESYEIISCGHKPSFEILNKYLPKAVQNL